jgi:hypothetical protein
MADKALTLGINDYKNVNSLRGCVADTETIRAMLIELFNFPERNIRTFTNEQVVKAEVQKQFAWLFQGAKPGDRVVLHFSGHGSYVDDKDGDEPDGRDELIALYDMDFDDPDTYLLDDELREWTKTKPPGVELTVVLDNCHSGTGTRMLLAAATGGPLRPAEVDPAATVKRSMSQANVSRGLEVAHIAARAVNPQNENMVRVRFIDPPEAIKAKVAQARSRALSRRGLVEVKELNHVLLAACRADQTAADATIDGKPSGAFTYYLDRTIRAGGARIQRRALIDKLAENLTSAHFSQVPQLEGPGDGPLFAANDGGDKPGTPAPSKPKRPPREAPPGSDAGDSAFLAMLDKLVQLDPDSRRRVLDLYERQFGVAVAGRDVGAGAGGVAGQRVLVTVHGICKHLAGYSDPWWNALHPFTNEFGAGNRGDSRREVLWSDLVEDRGIELRATKDEQSAKAELLREQIREALQDRIDRHAIESGPRSIPGETPRALSDTRALISIPGLNCIDDFLVYMTDNDVRAQIVGRFTEVVRPLLEEAAELDIISHSWGTVVAYEGLRELADQDGLASPRVRNLFTVGAALSIGPVKTSLRPANQDGRKPGMVRRWVNLNAHGDPVGGPLQGRPYAVDFDFPNLVPIGCTNFLGIINPSCAHGSYFVAGNLATNRDIFAHFIDDP